MMHDVVKTRCLTLLGQAYANSFETKPIMYAPSPSFLLNLGALYGGALLCRLSSEVSSYDTSKKTEQTHYRRGLHVIDHQLSRRTGACILDWVGRGDAEDGNAWLVQVLSF